MLKRIQIVFTKEKSNFEKFIDIQNLDCKVDDKDKQKWPKVIIENHKTIRKLMETNGGRHILISQPIYDLHETAKQTSKYWSTKSLEFRQSVVREVMKSNFAKKTALILQKFLMKILK